MSKFKKFSVIIINNNLCDVIEVGQCIILSATFKPHEPIWISYEANILRSLHTK